MQYIMQICAIFIHAPGSTYGLYKKVSVGVCVSAWLPDPN